MKLIRFLSIYFLTTFLSLFVIYDASAFENPVVPNGELGEFRHGTFPSPPLGEFTHVGVDIIAPCGSDIYAFSDGKVKDIIDSTNDKNFNTLGYMVLIEHPASLIGKKFYTLYLHMQRPPEVKIGNQVTGGRTVIGNVGSSGKTLGGCHTHFEIRYFPERFSVWGNIYCPDDQRYSEYFKQNWEDPLTFFRKYPNRHKLVKISGGDNNVDKSKLILGSWKDEDSKMEYFRDGTFISNADIGKRYTGTWSIEGNILRLQFINPLRVLNVYTIIEMTDSTYKIKLNHADKHTSNARRIEPSKQSHVYVAKDSRAYHHDRNCSNISTTDGLMEFSSPQKAKASGGILCEHCDPSAYDRKEENIREKQSAEVRSNTQTNVDSNEKIYSGNHKDGKQHGREIKTWPNGDKYVGELNEDKPHGQGTMTYADGSKYEGEWKDGEPHGYGTFTGHNGDKYVGELKDDKPHGQGTYIWADGSKYEGEWKDEEMHGQGTYTDGFWLAPKYIVGEWRNGIRYADETFSSEHLNKFDSKNGVNAWPSTEGLYANPFVYEGKTVGISVFFQKMESATSGIFKGERLSSVVIVVSNIPKGLFTASNAHVILAGNVLGNTELKLPPLGVERVPHLKFIDYLLPDK